MNRLILSLCSMLFGLLLGIVIRGFYNKRKGTSAETMPPWLVACRTVGLYVLNPVAIICVFWVQKTSDTWMLILPPLCWLSLTLGGVAALLFSKIFKHTSKKTGAMFTVGSFSNMGSFGSIISYAFFGEMGYAIATAYRLGEELYYYGIGFPLANYFGSKKKSGIKSAMKTVKIDKRILIFLGAFALGLLLNFTGISQPVFFNRIIGIIVPASTFLTVLASGYTIDFGKVRSYIKECVCVSLIKYIIVPILMMSVFNLLKIQYIQDGLALKVLIIMTFLPSALVALIPTQIYDLDYNLANSCWLTNTVLYFLVLPILIVFLL